ncbi:MAG TPA: M48 family metallopeptidase [Candidatus Cloacimonadota bacterium]|nr:M48 family metallopeptidase [Candidatus Cloacimonadota bacterium]HPK40377.1 M48 family metallopeptidase [Candidatus Cloacimonadota bacterium]
MSEINYTKLRYESETVLVKILEEDFAIKNYYDIFENEDELKQIVNQLLSDSVKLNDIIAPRLYQICEKAKKMLHFTEDIDFFIISSIDVNAFSINGFTYVPHMICLTSALVKLLTDDELLFVIGHEIGHLIYKHSQLYVVNSLMSNREEHEIPAHISNIFTRWNQYAELSSDRIGYVVQPNLEIIGNVFFKFASGLSEQHLNFNIKEYLKQLDTIKELKIGDFYSSHPGHLIRLKSLELFSKSTIYPLNKGKKGLIKLKDLNKDLNDLISLIEFHPKDDDEKNAVEFISAVGTYIAYADGEMNSQEWEMLYEYLIRFTSKPEQYLVFKNMKEIEKRSKAICKFYGNQIDNEDKYILFQLMMKLVIADGRLEEEEKTKLFEIGKELKISEKRIKEIIREESENYLSPRKKLTQQNLFVKK